MYFLLILGPITWLLASVEGAVLKTEKDWCKGENEELINCADCCVPTCQRPYPQNCQHRTRGSHLETICACKPGYVRRYLGENCIPESDCENSCRDNEIWTKRRSPCPDMCDGVQPCIRFLISSCTCAPGFVLQDYITEMCSRKQDCPDFYFPSS